MANVYHKELLDDPAILLQMGVQKPLSDLDPVTALDALVGAVSRTYPNVITSANADFIPSPFLGNTQSVYMRADYRYGPEDHIQWPQAFVPEYGHHICVERRHHVGLLAGLWATPSKDIDFNIDQSIAHGIGLLTPRFFTDVQMAVSEACDRYINSASPKVNTLLNRYRALLAQFEMTLQHTPLPFFRTLLILRLYQRTALELRAYQIYMNDVWPILADKSKLPKEPLRIKKNWMGAFTFDAAVAQKLFLVGCPVWVVREAKLARSFRCFKLVPLQEPGDHGVVLHEHERSSARLSPIFDGSPLSHDKYHRMHMWTSNHVVNFENPYARSQPLGLAPRPTGPLPSASTSSRPVQLGSSSNVSRNKGHALPYKKANVFKQAYHLILPKPVHAWVRALESTEEDFKICVVDTPTGYFVPRPETFVTGGTDEKRAQYIVSWLRLRPVFLSLYAGLDVVPVWQRLTISHQAWRTWLLEGRLDVESAKSNSAAGKREARLRDEIVAKVDELRTGDPDVGIISSPLVPRWHNETFRYDPSAEDCVVMCREILWEVGELGFRMDLMLLDAKVSYLDADIEHHRLLQDCFRVGDRLVTSVDLGMVNTGLAEMDWMTRAPFVWALKKLAMRWRGEHTPAISAECPNKGYSKDDFEQLELDVAQYYIITFFTHFRRPPTLPLQLSHIPDASKVRFTPPYVEQRPPLVAGHWKPLTK